jgi:hypothetical protein
MTSVNRAAVMGRSRGALDRPPPPASALLELLTGATYNVGTLYGELPAAASGGVGAPFTGQFGNSHHLRERSK